MFPVLLRELCDTVPQPPQVRGRSRLPLGDMVYAMATKLYANRSTRRAMSKESKVPALPSRGTAPVWQSTAEHGGQSS